MTKTAKVSMLLATLLAAGCAPLAQTAPPTPTATPSPDLALTAAPQSTPQPTQAITPTEEVNTVILTIVYDNNRYDERLRDAWGFSCLVETGGATVLFDTGGDSPTLLGNAATLGIDLQAIDAVVLSHAHGDHVGGLGGLLSTGVQPRVYAPSAFSASFKDGVRAYTELLEVTGPVEILPGIHTTGELGAGIVEQALVVEAADGLVVVTGCAHPGIAEMVRRAKEIFGGEVALVIGGFHLGSASEQQIERIIASFREMGVRQVAPCHCTGERAIQMFAAAYGSDFVQAGVGKVIVVGSEEGSQ